MERTQGEVNHVDGQFPKPSVLDDLLGVSSTSMDVDPSSVNGETELNAYMRVQQVANDTDPLMWWNLFSIVGLVKSDLRGSLLDTTLIDVMHTSIYVTDTHQYLSLEHTNIYSAACRLTVPHTWQSLPTINQLLIRTSIDKFLLISTQY